MKRFARLFVMIEVLTWGMSHAQSTFVLSPEQNRTSQSLQEYVQILEAESADWPLEEVIPLFSTSPPLPNKFKKFTIYWAKLSISNPTGQSLTYVVSPDWELGLHSNSVIDLHIIQGGKRSDSLLKSGRYVPASQHQAYKPPNNQFVLSFPPNSTTELYFRLEQIDGKRPSANMYLLDYIYWEGLNRETKSTIWAFFQGVFWILFAYALITFFMTKEKAYLFYALYLSANALYLLYLSGFFKEIFLEEHPKWSLYFWIFFTNFIIVSYLQFGRTFVESKRLIPRWDKVAVWILIGVGITAVVEFVLCLLTYNEPLLNLIINVVILLISGFLFSLIIRYLNSPIITARIFLWGSLLVVIGAVWGVMMDFIDHLEANLPIMEIFFVGELLTFAIGLSYRLDMHQKESERERLKAEEQKALNELQSRFFTQISHEFRTPLTVIKGNSQQLSQNWEDLRIPEVRNRLSAIERNGDNLLQLVNQILELAKIESGQVSPSRKKVELIGFTRYLLSSLETYAQDKQIKLSFSTPQEELFLDMDPAFYQDIFINLLSNALKFTPADGRISVELSPVSHGRKTEVELCVKDSGVGIAKEHLAQIFTPFFSQNTVQSNFVQGIGLGLSLVKERVELLGGSIEVQSTVQKGTLFRVLLPLKDSKLDLWTQMPKVHPIVLTTETSDSPESVSPTAKTEGSHLLIIEDHPDVRNYLYQLLGKEYEISLAKNGEDGIKLAKELVPNLIVCDLMMPDLDGYEVMENLKNDTLTSHIPFILLTAKASEEERMDALGKGADGFLVKPPNEQELRFVLNNIYELQTRTWEYFSKHSLGVGVNPQHRREHSFLTEVQQVVVDHLLDPDFGIEELAEACKMRDYQLRRKLKAVLGRPPGDFIRWVRLQEAQKRLLTTDENISEVAYAVGFTDPNHFSRVFKKEFDCTPSEFRKQS